MSRFSTVANLTAFLGLGIFSPSSYAALLGQYTFEGDTVTASSVNSGTTFSNFGSAGVTVNSGGFVTGNPGRGKADLNIGGEGVEVKAYDSKNMAFGRIGSDKENLELLNTLFGLYSLDSIVSDKEKKDSNKQPNSLRFSKQDIINAFKIAQKFNEDTKLKDLSAEYPLIYNIYARLSNLVKKLPENTNINDAEDAAGALMKNILLRKSLEKIGSKGYIVNVSPNGNLEYFKIVLSRLELILQHLTKKFTRWLMLACEVDVSCFYGNLLVWCTARVCKKFSQKK